MHLVPNLIFLWYTFTKCLIIALHSGKKKKGRKVLKHSLTVVLEHLLFNFTHFIFSPFSGRRIINTWQRDNVLTNGSKDIQRLSCRGWIQRLTNMTNIKVGCVYLWPMCLRKPTEWEHFVFTVKTEKWERAKKKPLCILSRPSNKTLFGLSI